MHNLQLRRSGVASLATLALLVLAGCGSSSSTKAASTGGTARSSTSAASPSAPGTAFRVATVSGLGAVVVDGRGRTVYVLTADGKTNAPCDDASGCTKAWPDLALPDGTTAATAGTGLTASLLSTKKLASGETYPTYGGWLMYEFSFDKAAGDGRGEGIKSFGGTWYALGADGMPITSATGSTTTRPAVGVGGY
jgi:predicted lipoprotein with Yx(FWY)xxD motif